MIDISEYIFYVYVFVILLSVLIGSVNFRKFDDKIKIIFYLLVVTCLSEIISRIIYYFLATKNPVYHFFNIFELSIISVYFLKTTRLFYSNSNLIAILLATIYSILGIINFLYLQPLMEFNSNFITLESFLVIGMSLYALYSILISDSITSATNYPHFWLWALLLFYFSCTFFFWPFIKFFYINKSPYFLPAEYIE